MLSGIVGVAIIGGLANTAIAATGSTVNNGILIFYSGFTTCLVGVLASRADAGQRILTPNIVSIPFIDWMLMISHSLMAVCGTAFFLKAVKSSTPSIAIVLTKVTYIIVLYTAYCILSQQIPDTLTIIALVVMIISSIGFCAEFAILRRLPTCCQRCF